MKENIEVSVGEHPEGGGKREAIVHDQVARRAWTGEGKTDSQATTEAVRKFLGDRRVREYVE